MNANVPVVLETLWLQLRDEIRGYAASRKRDVERGAETPELAGLLVEKYGLGIAKSAALIAAVFDTVAPEDLTKEVDRWVVEIDPECRVHRAQRWEARPAGLTTDGKTQP